MAACRIASLLTVATAAVLLGLLTLEPDPQAPPPQQQALASFTNVPSVEQRSAIERRRWSSSVRESFDGAAAVPRVAHDGRRLVDSDLAERLIDADRTVVISNMPVRPRSMSLSINLLLLD